LEPTQSPVQVSFAEIKRPGRYVDQSSLSGGMAKNEFSYTSTSPAYFHGVDRNNLGLLSE